MKKAFLISLLLASGSIATAKPHHPKRFPAHAKICRQCDGDGLVRTWKKAWFGKRKCKACNGKGYFLMPPAPKPPPAKFHKKDPAHARKGERAHKPAPPRKNRRK